MKIEKYERLESDKLRGLIEDYAWAMKNMGNSFDIEREEEVRQAEYKLSEYLKEGGL